MEGKVLAIGTRFFESNAANSSAALERLRKWVEGALTVTTPDRVMVAINIRADKSGAREFLSEEFPQVTAIPVEPWGKFVAPLNAIVAAAAGKNADQILFTSAEFPPSKEVVEILQKYLVEETLVVGARLAEHNFVTEGKGTAHVVEYANGLQVPWNTYALWDTRQLAKTGFILAGDSPYDPDNAGVEELATIALHEQDWGTTARLVHVDGIPGEWDMTGWDDARKAAHQKKMASKVSRPQAQMKNLGWDLPLVYHMAPL